MQLRSSDPRFLSLVDAWWQQLLPRLAPLTYARGGPIILVQVLFPKHACCLNIHTLLSAYTTCPQTHALATDVPAQAQFQYFNGVDPGACLRVLHCNTIHVPASQSRLPRFSPRVSISFVQLYLLGAVGIHGSCEPMVMQVVDGMAAAAPTPPALVTSWRLRSSCWTTY